MIIQHSLPFIRDYVSELNAALKQQAPQHQLTRLQRYWLSFVILGVLVTNSLCWSRFERFSLGDYSLPALSWMFRRAKIAWDFLLFASAAKILEKHGIKRGILAFDDTDSERSKQTTRIAKVHCIRDKKHGGFFRGQEVVFLILITKELTIPVGFELYEPDPKVRAWRKERESLKSQGVSNDKLPKKPERDDNYPTKIELALRLLRQFKERFNSVRIRAVVADGLYCTKEFFAGAVEATHQPQVISQIRKNQCVQVDGKWIQIKKLFSQLDSQKKTIKMRHKEKEISYCCLKSKVKSHGKKRYVIALKYSEEKEYRYILASDMTWLEEDVLKAYATRWLVEVFIQDWKSYEGWDQLAMQQGLMGAQRGLTISLLTDHVLHFHQDQLTLAQNKQPAATVGSLRERVIMESLTAFIQNILSSENPQEAFRQYGEKITELFQLRSSCKHMRGLHM